MLECRHTYMNIRTVLARQILDSRGNPTIEADVILEDGTMGRAAVPSGASTGSAEALELRDGGKAFLGKGVLLAKKNIETEIRDALVGLSVGEQGIIDQKLLDTDGTDDKGRLGANALLAVSLAVAHAAANFKGIPLYQHIYQIAETEIPDLLPSPMINIINGGKHASGSTDIQEFMILPSGAQTFSDAIRMGAEIFQMLGKVIREKGYQTTVGDEGGYAPQVKNGNAEALELIKEAVDKAGYVLGKDIVLSLDVAATELYEDGKYHLKTEGKVLSTEEMIDFYEDLISRYPIVSIEDGLSEDDWQGWQRMTERLGQKVQLVGDDLLVTNTKLLKKSIEERAANAILIKPNQIGTLTETIQAVRMAQSSGWKTVMSHRSGETEDTTIAHLAVGLSTGQIKTGSLCRTDRVAKYNELLRIEEILGSTARYNSQIR